jgi:hypothetical protein
MRYILFILLFSTGLTAQTHVLYDINTGKTLTPFYQGNYTVDGKPGQLEPHQYELTVRYATAPEINSVTQRLISGFVRQGVYYSQVWVIVDKTPEEMEAEFKASVPFEITKRQATLGMYMFMGLEPHEIPQFITSNITDPQQQKIALIEWEYATSVERQNPLVAMFAAELELTEREVDEFFITASKL